MKIMKLIKLSVLSISVMLFAGCSNQLIKQAVSPQAKSTLSSGTALLNVSGLGLEQGDVVNINAAPEIISYKDTILFDWRRLTQWSGGFGGNQMVGSVIALPGEQVDMASLHQYRDHNGKDKNAWFNTFKTRGVKGYGDKFTLAIGDYLVETDTSLIVMNRAVISAIVVERLGNEMLAEREVEQHIN